MLSEMRTFALLAEEGSIQRVAERLPLTQPAVTRQIQRLEQFLGTELLDRRQKPPAFTPAGLEMLARSRRILGEIEEMRRLAKDATPRGVLRLGMANGLADGRIAALIGDLKGRFPNVTLRLVTGWSDELRQKFDRGLLDAAFILTSQHDRAGGMAGEQEPLVIIAPRDQAADLRAPTDFAGQSWILSPEPCDARERLAEELMRHGIPLTVAAEVQDARLQLGLVEQGIGLGLMPRRLLSQVSAEVSAINAPWLDLTLRVEVKQSPFLNSLAPVVEYIAVHLSAQCRASSVT
ncbi:LysR family transcriptional regulator [Rhizobium leucaenae]|uniref:LysR family transcriptional regulator n=1 Tax=Rhizobium leucaenae TaxID=29450 RepID=UPI0016103FAC|nr:LysR family transcriptional regulator [Rhizobium leucaenae]